MQIRIDEIFRYLGYFDKNRKRAEKDPETLAMVEEILEKLVPKCSMKRVFAEFPVSFAGENVVRIGDGAMAMEIESKSLCVNLKGCDSALLFACTLGAFPDLMVNRYERTSLARAAVTQAVCTEVIEAFAEDCMQELSAHYGPDRFLKPRFSPGYGDFSLGHQRDFFRMLPIEAKLGVRLTDELLMTPTKSITAVIGLTGNKESCSIAHCRDCLKKDCEFRDEF